MGFPDEVISPCNMAINLRTVWLTETKAHRVFGFSEIPVALWRAHTREALIYSNNTQSTFLHSISLLVEVKIFLK